MTHVIYCTPLGKPRMTQRDKWQSRPCVLRYRVWCDLLRLKVLKRTQKLTLHRPIALTIRAYFDPGRQHRTGPHTLKPDSDNVAKACCDALFQNDEMVYKLTIQKLWCDGGSPRVELEWE
jgi:Holliday junction resolvase RusA-like endonuclease